MIIILLVALLLLGIGLFFAMKNDTFSNFIESTRERANVGSNNKGEDFAVKEGKLICLPEHPTGTDIGENCRFGIVTFDSVFYELSNVDDQTLKNSGLYVGNAVSVEGNVFVYLESENRDTYGSIAVLGISSMKSSDGKIQDCPDDILSGDLSEGSYIYNSSEVGSDQFDTAWISEHCELDSYQEVTF